jgi:phosphoribosylformylglycinamidine synthase subunit PurQ / glutaminase
MKAGVIIFPGSNCDADMVNALRYNLGMEVETVWHKETTLPEVDLVVLPGGFSYGDYLRSGAIARFSPIMEAVRIHAEAGKLLLGVCNGFQILTEAGLLPGALLANECQRFQCENRTIRVETTNNALTAAATRHQVLNIPIAHADGRYHATEALLAELNANDQVLLRYCNAEGSIESDHNANGSAQSIAGICNHTRNVMGLMPHPERASAKELGNTDGLFLLKGLMLAFA